MPSFRITQQNTGHLTAALVVMSLMGSPRPLDAQAQQSANLGAAPIAPVIEAQLPRSLISPDAIGLPFPLAVNTLDDLLFEADIQPHFNVIGSKFPPVLREFIHGMVITPRVTLRMSTDDSKPVRSPSYIPHVTVYSPLPLYGDDRDFLVWTLAHYSNGQEGETYVDGVPNWVDGSFSDFYAEIGPSLSTFWERTALYVIPSVKRHFAQDRFVAADYGQWRVRTRLRVNRDTNFDLVSLDRVGGRMAGLWQYELDVAWNVDRNGDVSPLIDLSGSLSWFPAATDMVGVFVGAYTGSDYYNARYNSGRLSYLRFGLTTR